MVGYLEEKEGVKSTTRLGHVLIAIGVFMILLAMAAYIIIFAVKIKEISNWEVMGIFLIGVASVFTGSAWQKTQQKKIE